MIQHLLAAILAAVVAANPYLNVPVNSIQPLQVAVVDGPDATICTAFSINEKTRMWGTAAHCVLQQDDEGQIHARQTRMGGKPTVLMFANAALDVAVIQAEVSAPAIPLAKRPAVGDVVRVYGYLWGSYSPTIFKGEISNLNADSGDGRYMLFDMSVGGGHSGSPILDINGAVVSVMQISARGGFSGGALYGYLDELLPYWQN